MIASAIHIIEQIADRLASDGWYVGESIFDAALGACEIALTSWRPRGPATRAHCRSTAAQGQTDIRRDDTRGWLMPRKTRQNGTRWWRSMPANDTQYRYRVGARSAELHFARYAPAPSTARIAIAFATTMPG